jgi:dolichol-phosphate mannosyltransferase
MTSRDRSIRSFLVDLEAAASPEAPSGRPASEVPRPVELTIVVPTFNERGNIAPLIEKLERVLAGIAWEAIFVDDDSPDETSAAVRAVAQRKPNIRCLQRIGRRGLSTACIEGILASAAPFVAVMDADLQHDEALLPAMLATLKAEKLDIVVGSRYVAGGGLGGLDRSRALISDFAGRLSRLVVKAELRDPMSGFFMMTRPAFEGALRQLSGQGFKILLDIFASAPQRLAFKELPYQFRSRLHGESKLDTLVAWEYVLLLLDKLVGHVVPVRFALFAVIGGSGLVVQLAALGIAYRMLDLDFDLAQTLATLTAMTSNFFLNNWFTYRDRRLRGWRLVRGLISFYVVCSVGLVGNVGIAHYAFHADQAWWVAGAVGAVVGAVWNYAASSVFTWRTKTK